MLAARAGDSVRSNKPDQGEKRLMFFRSRMMLVAATVRPDGRVGHAQDAVKIGLILPRPEAGLDRQADRQRGSTLYMQQKGDTSPAGRSRSF